MTDSTAPMPADAPRRRRLGLIAGSTAAVMVGGGVAIAFWTANGTGVGEAGAGTTQDLTITQVLPAPTGLFPGSPAANIEVTITNPGTSTVVVNTVTTIVDPAPTVVTDDPADADGCAAADFAVVDVALAAPLTLLAGATSPATLVATLQLTETGVNQNDCKGVTVPLAFTSN